MAIGSNHPGPPIGSLAGDNFKERLSWGERRLWLHLAQVLIEQTQRYLVIAETLEREPDHFGERVVVLTNQLNCQHTFVLELR